MPRVKMAEDNNDVVLFQKILVKEIKGYLVACIDGSMSRNNSQQLAHELLEMINGNTEEKGV